MKVMQFFFSSMSPRVPYKNIHGKSVKPLITFEMDLLDVEFNEDSKSVFRINLALVIKELLAIL